MRGGNITKKVDRRYREEIRRDEGKRKQRGSRRRGRVRSKYRRAVEDPADPFLTDPDGLTQCLGQ